MSQNDAEKWNARYQLRDLPNSPAQVLTENIHLLSDTGEALELASGLGGNSLLLAQQGYQVTALDLSNIAVKKLKQNADQLNLSIQPENCDLENWIAPIDKYHVVMVSGYYQPSLFEQIRVCLKPGGLVFYQTYTQLKVNDNGPNNPDFLLSDGELLTHFSDYEVIAYQENRDLGDIKQGLRNQAYIVARKPC